MWQRIAALAALSAALTLGVAGCEPTEYFPIDDGPAGPVCYSDSDCVPSGCCGQGTRAVHISEAPDCRGISCTGACDPDLIDCNCAYPYCRDGRCVAASTFADECL